MKSTITSDYNIYSAEEAKTALLEHLDKQDYSKIFVLVDDNTKVHCLPVLEEKLGYRFDNLITIRPGEDYKTIRTCTSVWEALSNNNGDRRSLLLNLGGGVLTDLGGFVAATFKRGIDFIHIPTTLLSMVDAAIGGKTGIDLGVLKNQVGVITPPQMVLVWPEFLKTLDMSQITSGYAEMLKHGLIRDAAYWEVLRNTHAFTDTMHIQKSINIKQAVVAQDPLEKGLRKILNFGHTLGHAIESYCLENPDKRVLLHGEAIAIGMILEGYLSFALTGLPGTALQEIKDTFLHYFDHITFSEKDIEAIIELLKHDKKNSHGNINFVLLEGIGKAVADIQVPDSLFQKAFAYYKKS